MLARVLRRARWRCSIGIGAGLVLVAAALAYEWWASTAFGLMITNIYVIAVGLLPGAPGLYAIGHAILRVHLLSQVEHRPETISLVELEWRWAQPALGVVFHNGEKVTFATGRAEREALMIAIGDAQR